MKYIFEEEKKEASGNVRQGATKYFVKFVDFRSVGKVVEIVFI